ncbi:VOC family protein [Emticicia agri]|uniref:VOC family protein n=1 Tax=Emticicia agri TaxID=2492393 RepID=A0A4Q5M3S9_9BACT|nr:VOC family protein [Emticicia agri]RYU96974.1 VOC family protein [Emticicia agri]
MSEFISGIQQVGIGVRDAAEAFNWYNRTLGLNVPLFDDVAEAKLMTPHTNGIIRQRRAILALNMAGGGGAEIWQSNRPEPVAPEFMPELGDYGIFALKIKSSDVKQFAGTQNLKVETSPENKNHSWLQDPYGNQLQIVADNSWFKPNSSLTGGVVGVIIGVSDIAKALKLYKDTLGISEVAYDKSGKFEDFATLGKGNVKFRRVLLRKAMNNNGAFSRLLGNVEIELVQNLEADAKPRKIFEKRSWGDLGFIHLCFDTLNMDNLKQLCQKNGFPFTVDSSDTFDMGEAGGRFTYIEDPDGTLIEFVETHRVPILKKIGWYLNLKKRKTQKPLPDWMVATMGWGKVKAKD